MTFGFNNMTEEERAYMRQRAEEARFQAKTRYQIEDDMYICVDQYNYILQRKNKDNSFTDITYHSDLAAALTSYLEYATRKAILRSDDGRIEDLIETVKSEKDKQSDAIIKLLETVSCKIEPVADSAEPEETAED